MTALEDHELLAEFTRTGSETAFAALVTRHLGLVYSTALRFSNNPHHAQEITQAVFIILARKAGKLSPRVVLSGWLYQTARLTAANFIKCEIRRQRREQEVYMQSFPTETDPLAWEKIAPLLDEAMGGLGETDRNAVVLRYFENKNAAEIGVKLRMTEETARKRVNRALEKLRKFFHKRGVASTTTMIAGAISANSVQAAPAGLAHTISAIAITNGALAGSSTLTLVKGALKIMAWTKMQTTIVVSAVLLAAGTTTVTIEKIHQNEMNAWQLAKLNSLDLEKPPFQTAILPTKSSQRTKESRPGGSADYDDGKTVGINFSVADIVPVAYGSNHPVSLRRVIFKAAMPGGKFDYLSNVPAGPKQALQKELRRQFGIAGTFEMINTNVLLLTVKYPSPPGLTPSIAKTGRSDIANGYMTVKNGTMNELAKQLESTYFGIPTIDQTGLTNHFDYAIDWGNFDQSGKGNGSRLDARDDLKKVLLNQLGLELIPTNMSIEMLVVDKVK